MKVNALASLNYGRIYTVEYFLRVLNIGMVDGSSLEALKQNSLIR